MKRTLFFMACVLASLTMSAQDDLTVEDIQNSGCTALTRGAEDEELVPMIVLMKEGSILSVQLINYEANCCTHDFGVMPDISGGSDGEPCSVSISVAPDNLWDCDCICPFNVSFTVRDLEPDCFYLKCWWYEGMVELTDGEPLVLEYKIENVTIDGISFRLIKVMHKAMLMKWTSDEDDLRIPSEVTYEGESYTVTCIAKDAFWNIENASKITFPKTIRSTDLNMDGIIWANPVRECKSLEWIEVEEGCPLFSSIDGILFAENKTMLLGYPIASPRETYTVPEGVTKIRSGAFHHNKYLRKLVIPEKVTDLGWHLFSDTKSLEELYIKGVLDPDCMYTLFDGMDTKVVVYVQPSQVDKFKDIYKGPVYPLPEQTIDYRPVVEEGKRWTYDNYIDVRPDQYNYYYNYELKGDTVIGGKHCLKMYVENHIRSNKVEYFGALYEEDRRVYYFDIGSDKAVKLYDFNCNVGDSVFVSCGRFKVAEIKNVGNAEYSGRLYRLVSEKEQMELRWIEGVGSMQDFFGMLPLPGNYNGIVSCELNGEKLYQYVQPDYTSPGYHKMAIEGKTWNHIHYYTDESGIHEEPYSYIVKGDTIIGRTVYKKLYRRDGDTERLYSILFEKGREILMMRPGSMGWTQLFDFGRTDFGRVFTWESKQGMGTVCWMPHHVDTISVRGTDFRRYVCYQQYLNTNRVPETIEDGEDVWHDLWVEGVGSQNTGIEFQTISHEQLLPSDDYCRFVSCYENGECIFTANDFNVQTDPKPVEYMAYRPFVEDGKVWKVGGDESGNPVKLVEYYYFDGDTIIDGKTCKRMMCQRYVNPDYADYDNVMKYYPLLSYMGAWYEEDQKVYFFSARDEQFTLWYDFSLDANDSLRFYDVSFVIGPRQTGGIKGFKGVYREVEYSSHPVYKSTWLEGVGNIIGPIRSDYFGKEGHSQFLMSCTVGDEVIYLNDEYEDGATPDGARKQRIDFTHTIKIKPQSRTTRGAEASLYGEYNEQQLGINLNALDDAYLVRITDESGKAVYEKTVNAGNIVGLNIDISDYAEGRYIVTVENSNESFTAQFDTHTTEIVEVRRKREEGSDCIYNLQGQRLTQQPRKGVYIRDGRKIVVK